MSVLVAYIDGSCLNAPVHTAWRVQPRNYLLFACHLTNATAQTVQDIRFWNYWHNGGREKKLALRDVAEEDLKKR